MPTLYFAAITYNILLLSRRVDYEHYLASFFLPAAARNAFFAIRALNAETAVIKDNVSKIHYGLARLQFWRGAVEAVYRRDTVPAHPVAIALSASVSQYKLTRSWFARLFDERERDLANRSPATMEELERYAENTASSLLYLALECAGVKNIHADHVASHIGKAVGIATILRGAPFHFSRSSCYLPLSLMAKHSVSQEELFRGHTPPALAEIVYEVASSAKLHIDHARQLAQNIPKAARPVLLPSIAAADYLERLRLAHFNVFDPTLQRRPPMMLWKLWAAYLRGKY